VNETRNVRPPSGRVLVKHKNKPAVTHQSYLWRTKTASDENYEGSWEGWIKIK